MERKHRLRHGEKPEEETQPWKDAGVSRQRWFNERWKAKKLERQKLVDDDFDED